MLTEISEIVAVLRNDSAVLEEGVIATNFVPKEGKITSIVKVGEMYLITHGMTYEPEHRFSSARCLMPCADYLYATRDEALDEFLKRFSTDCVHDLTYEPELYDTLVLAAETRERGTPEERMGFAKEVTTEDGIRFSIDCFDVMVQYEGKTLAEYPIGKEEMFVKHEDLMVTFVVLRGVVADIRNDDFDVTATTVQDAEISRAVRLTDFIENVEEAYHEALENRSGDIGEIASLEVGHLEDTTSLCLTVTLRDGEILIGFDDKRDEYFSEETIDAATDRIVDMLDPWVRGDSLI